METLTLILNFIGAWLLLIGALYQAAVDFREESEAQDRIRKAAHSIERPREISLWWWLMPPVKIVLERQRAKKHRIAFSKQLSYTEREELLRLLNKASGWLIVASGGLLIAFRSTYEVCKNFHMPSFVSVLLTLVLTLSSVFGVTNSLRRKENNYKD